ncbi:MAG: ATP-binding cassette domain-containing protein [Raineya sp.]
MSEQVLRAIIQLLAASAQVDGVAEQEREVIYKFLSDNFAEEIVEKYMAIFDRYASQKLDVKEICKGLNAELTRTQKVIVLANLLEMNIADGIASESEQRLVAEIAGYFNLNTDEYELLRRFIIEDFTEANTHNNIVWIDGIEKAEMPYKHIYREKLEGAIGVLRIASMEMYLLKYAGKTDISLNGVSIKDHHVYTFPVGSSIRSDKFEPVYYSDIVSLFLNENQEHKISFEANRIFYKFPSGKIGLRNITIAEESGKLIGLMGASGSGKSTLLNVLNGNLQPSQGQVLINGIDIHKSHNETAGMIGYVPQDDLLIEELTVYQNLYYAAKLSFGNATEEEIDNLVEKTLKSLGISEIQDLKVGKPLQKTISGGQRKRVNIGLELLREPYVLFVDEPTSGLSSRDSENIMVLFKELALRGKLVFIVIHQPSSDIFKMFDKLLILDVGGYPIYYGNPLEAITHFKSIAGFVDKDKNQCLECGNVNPEQIFNIIETKMVNEYGEFTDKRRVTPRKWYDYFEKLIPPPTIDKHSEKPKSNLSIPHKLKQVQIYLTRDVLSKLSNTQYMTINLLEAPLLAVILAYIVRFYQSSDGGYIFAKNNNLPAYIFMSVIVALFIGLSVSAEEIIKDAKIRKRELFLHLSRNSYLFAKIVLLFGFSAIQTLSFVILGNWILGIEQMNFMYWLVLFSTTCFANMLGLNISATFDSVVTIYILIPLLLIPQLLLGGIVVRFNEINPALASDKKVPPLAEIMASRWAFEALTVGQFKDNPYQKYFYHYDQKMAQAEYHKALYIPELETKLDNVFNFHKVDTLKNKIEQDLQVVINELSLQSFYTQITFKKLEQLTYNQFDASLYHEAKAHLQKLKKYYIDEYNDNERQKDKIVGELTKTPEGRAAYLQLKAKFHNEAIEKLVTAKETPERIITTEQHLVQKVYPIFKKPEPSGFLDFRTHFFAPKKRFAGRLYDTVYFNVAIIWLMSLFLYFTLYFKSLRNLIEFAANLRGRLKNMKKKD